MVALSTAVDPNAVARVIGIKTTFQNLRGGVPFLPIRIGVIGQGATASQASYDTTKTTILSAKAVGDAYGYGSPLHLAVKQLLPPTGDGVGIIPVTIYPLKGDGAGVAAAGTITPSGTQTTQASYKILINKIASLSFVLDVGDVLADALAAIIPAINGVIDMPVIASYGGTSSTGGVAGAGNTGNGTMGAVTPTEPNAIGGDYELVCTNAAVSGSEIFSVTDPSGVALPDLTVGVAYSGHFVTTLADGVDDFIVGDTWTIPVVSTEADLTAKWKGVSGNDIYAELDGTAAGVAFAFVQPTGGLVEPNVDTATAQVGDVWDTFFVNCLSVSDIATLTKYTAFFDARWGALSRKPAIVFSGETESTVATAYATAAARTTDRINCQIDGVGSYNLPFVIAAKAVAKIAVIANNNPPIDYAGQSLNGLTPGLDSEQWDYTARNSAVSNGISTIEIVDNLMELSDTVTFYHPDGEDPPAYRYVNDQVKVWNILFNLGLIFESDDWKGKVLIPDGQATSNPDARKPSDAKAAIAKMIDELALNAILSDPETAKATLQAEISSTNPRRLDVAFTSQISGNTGIISIDNNWGFFFGS